ncbi:LysR family transcriptional regulator [Campylobacter geochelonis]|uniref:Transcriptional regulator n=1 Tax=Campylobacter geochelonis TaxID=1780362 RepID=A0A128EDN5_9BACT|nr:LysR family transcriptional regulator [Campylobacter geochelonis]QKF70959.1 transcriptional regulator, LysR family [Campylobacter geochelonis]CZE47039.1 transcriptional regulator [Campylobacter geochelonis]CZE47530.1 transcriptional regulator [Campylobacter geochelonis]CZE50225.1 transcriptional regulator [Campylobacter geochelonis]
MFTDFNIINTFLVIVEERSFSRASKALGISQPAVTLQMKKLEEIVGATLILRKKNGILLTKEGEKFKELCQKFEITLQVFSEEASNIKNAKSKLVVATTPIIHECIIPLILDDISSTFDLGVDVRVKNEEDILKYIEDRRCDLAIVNDKYFGKDIIYKHFNDYNFVLVSNQPVAKKLAIKDLYKLNFIKDASKTYFDALFSGYSIRYSDLNATYTLDSTLAVINALIYNSNQQYFAFLPEFIAKRYIKDSTLFEAKIENIKLKRTLFVVSLKENEDKLNKFITIKEPEFM